MRQSSSAVYREHLIIFEILSANNPAIAEAFAALSHQRIAVPDTFRPTVATSSQVGVQAAGTRIGQNC
jgi:hypothetical protein